MKTIYLSTISFLLVGCAAWNPTLNRAAYSSLEDAQHQSALHGNKVSLQGYYEDGSSIEFKKGWTVTDQSEILGMSRGRDELGRLTDSVFTKRQLGTEEIVLWRTSRKLKAEEQAILGGKFLAVATDLGVSLLCMTNPKICFGSCPTFYQGESDHLFKSDAEGFTNAILPSLEHADIDALPLLVAKGNPSLTLKNEALETHNIKSVKLLTIPQISGTQVFHSVRNSFFRTSNGISVPTFYEGEQLGDVIFKDNQEWFVPSNEEDLAAKIELDINVQPEKGVNYGLVMTYRQSLMSTYLFYGTLEHMGGDYARRMVLMDQSPVQKHWLLEGGIMQYLGGIEVKNHKGQRLGAFDETGPIAQNTQILPLGEIDGPLHLELTQGLWRIDHIELVEIMEEVEAATHEVIQVDHIGNPSTSALLALNSSEEHLVSLPGENWVLHFAHVPVLSHAFVQSEGYYHEWSRTTWNDPGHPRELNSMLLHPRKYLKEEAAAYKIYENEMEPLFWESRVQTPIMTSHED